MRTKIAESAVDDLRRAARGDGGFPERAGGSFSPPATAWATLALARDPRDSTLARRAAERLALAQQPDGRVPVSEAHADAIWPTPLALLAWLATESSPGNRDRAVEFLLTAAGTRYEENSAMRTVIGHNVTLSGWPWILGTYSWVEPTALAVLALRQAGQASHPRVQEGVRLLLDRQIPGGGWNYGSTTIYGTELPPQVDATGAALTALAGAVDEEAVRRSITFLEKAVPGVRTPFSLAWGIFGLSAWGRRPDAAATWVDDSLALADRYGGYDTTQLAMVLVAQDGGGLFIP